MMQPMQEQVAQVVEQLRRSVVQPDGGDLELVSLAEDGTVTIRLHGSCAGCASSTTTLRNGIERYLRHKLPGITRVVAVDA
jgi:Fe-S cluster biogenesis protein NfuA